MVPAARAVAVDTLQGEQWAVAPGAILDLPPAWQISQGAGVIVAVIDSGTTLSHPDLAPNLWRNPGEIPGNGLDDDGNGYIDDVNGVDLTTASNDNVPDDQDGHGTHVAGIIAGARNGHGIVGVAYKAKLMTIKVLDANGVGTTEGVAAGIRYATANGARIINMSLNGPSPSAALTAAVNAACEANVLLVVSAGNGAQNDDTTSSYPVSIPSPCMIGVASTGPDGGGHDLGPSSNYGRFTIALAAPGVEVLSTAMNGGYELRTGTSMAAPHVTGVAALVASVNPDLSAPDLRGKILSSARFSTLPVSSGYLVAAAAVRAAPGAVSLTLGQPPRMYAIHVQVSGKKPLRWLQAQISVSGSTAAVRRYDVLVRGRRIAVIHTRGVTFVVHTRVRTLPKRVTIVAIDSRGRTLATVRARVSVQRASKPNLGRDRTLARTSSRIWKAAEGPRARSSRRTRPPRAPAPVSTPNTIVLSGSETVGALVADLIYYYRRADPRAPRFTLIQSSTVVGVADALRGVVGVGLAARDRRASDPSSLVFTPMAGSAVCVATNRHNPIRNITTAQLRDVVAGRLTTWARFPGSRLKDPIAVFAEPEFEGAQTVFDDTFLTPDVPRVYQPRFVPSSPYMRRMISETGTALGWLDVAFTPGLNVPTVDGVPCTLASVAAGKYPARRGLNFVTKGAPTGATARFIKWARTSRAARDVIKTRYVPLDSAGKAPNRRR